MGDSMCMQCVKYKSQVDEVVKGEEARGSMGSWKRRTRYSCLNKSNFFEEIPFLVAEVFLLFSYSETNKNGNDFIVLFALDSIPKYTGEAVLSDKQEWSYGEGSKRYGCVACFTSYHRSIFTTVYDSID